MLGIVELPTTVLCVEEAVLLLCRISPVCVVSRQYLPCLCVRLLHVTARIIEVELIWRARLAASPDSSAYVLLVRLCGRKTCKKYSSREDFIPGMSVGGVHLGRHLVVLNYRVSHLLVLVTVRISSKEVQ